MQALYYDDFQVPIRLESLADPTSPKDGVVVTVQATGICRSDWHGWMGHDPDIELPHVPGHELAGTIAAVGQNVKKWKVGDRVTVPFVGGCGQCPQCASGNQQVCDEQFQPGFTHWGSFAEHVAIHYADENLVRLPESMDFVTAASLGCRFVTAFRAVVDQAKVQAEQWVAVHGCGGVGLSAIMIAKAMGAQIIAVDITEEKLAFAKKMGAAVAINARATEVVPKIYEVTEGGAHVSLDALGSNETSFDSIACLRKRGKHIQVGLMTEHHAISPVPMDMVIAKELEILGSHGMQAHRYPAMLAMIENGQLQPEKLIGQKVALAEAASILMEMDTFQQTGITVIDQF